GTIKPPVEREVEGRRLRVHVEAVEAGVERGGTKEHLVVKMRARVLEGWREAVVEKWAKFYKSSGGEASGYVNIYAGAEGGREADYLRTAAVLKALGVERWHRAPRQIRLTSGALEALMGVEPVCRTVRLC
ncbi:MAG: PaRep2b protein, partial [Pyrobaculum sp.]